MRFSFPVLLLLVGCAEPIGGAGRWELQSQTDQGSICVDGDADATATIEVDAQVCLSSSCSRDATGSCAATLDGTTITVTSAFSWEEAVGGRIACTDDCGFLGASCEVGPLAAGTYTVVHGDSSEEITIPTEGGDCPGA